MKRIERWREVGIPWRRFQEGDLIIAMYGPWRGEVREVLLVGKSEYYWKYPDCRAELCSANSGEDAPFAPFWVRYEKNNPKHKAARRGWFSSSERRYYWTYWKSVDAGLVPEDAIGDVSYDDIAARPIGQRSKLPRKSDWNKGALYVELDKVDALQGDAAAARNYLEALNERVLEGEFGVFAGAERVSDAIEDVYYTGEESGPPLTWEEIVNGVDNIRYIVECGECDYGYPEELFACVEDDEDETEELPDTTWENPINWDEWEAEADRRYGKP